MQRSESGYTLADGDLLKVGETICINMKEQLVAGFALLNSLGLPANPLLLNCL